MPVTKNLRDGIMKVRDGLQPVNNVLEIILTEGDLQFEEVRNVTNILDRGKLSHFREGDDEPISMSFTAKYTELIKQSNAVIPTLYEVLHFIGAAAGWRSTTELGGSCSDIKTLTFEFDIINPCAFEESERITFRKFYHTNIQFQEAEEYNTLAIEGIGYVKRVDVIKI